MLMRTDPAVNTSIVSRRPEKVEESQDHFFFERNDVKLRQTFYYQLFFNAADECC